MKTSEYGKMGIAKSFAVWYGMDLAPEIKQNSLINKVINIQVGETYLGEVKEFTKQYITFTIPGVKEELLCKENLTGCEESIQKYLLTHNNKLLFEVREKKDNRTDLWHIPFPHLFPKYCYLYYTFLSSFL